MDPDAGKDEIKETFVDTARAEEGSLKHGVQEKFVQEDVSGHLSTESVSAEEEQKCAQQGA